MPSRSRSQHGLDWLNFFMADVETAFGPFVATYLTSQGWSQGAVGSAFTVNSAITLSTQIPTGWLVDWMRRKRVILAACLACIAGGSLLMAFFPRYGAVVVAEALHGITGGAVPTALAAVALGLVGHRAFHTRIGRNQRYKALGNAVTAALMGILGYSVAPRAPFLVAAGLCLPAAGALALIGGKEIDYARARQAGPQDSGHARSRDLFKNRNLIVFAVCLFLFQFVSASLLPLASERLTHKHASVSALVTSALVAVPQLITALIAGWIAARADSLGRKRLLVLAFAAQLARAVLFIPATSLWVLLAVQALGGLTAPVIGIMQPLVVADCTRQTGRYNVTLGAVGMIAMSGATISTTATGFLAQAFGFTTAFLALALTAGGRSAHLMADARRDGARCTVASKADAALRPSKRCIELSLLAYEPANLLAFSRGADHRIGHEQTGDQAQHGQNGR
jgi:MFS family permease